MARKRHSDEDILKLLREIELALASGHDVVTACRSVGISDATGVVTLSQIERN
jgi:putative transposase